MCVCDIWQAQQQQHDSNCVRSVNKELYTVLNCTVQNREETPFLNCARDPFRDETQHEFSCLPMEKF